MNKIGTSELNFSNIMKLSPGTAFVLFLLHRNMNIMEFKSLVFDLERKNEAMVNTDGRRVLKARKRAPNAI